MRVAAIIQARMGSSRLPGKVLMDLAGEPLLARVVNRTRQAETVGEVVVVTTPAAADDDIVRACAAWDVLCVRGSEADVLDRYHQAAVSRRADVVVRITGDCPLIDPGLIDEVVREFLDRLPEGGYASNCLPRRTFPRGLDTEVMRFDVLERAWREDVDAASREHVTPYIWRNPDLFLIHGVTNETDYSHMRWTVDTPDDLAFVRLVYDRIAEGSFSWRDVVDLLDEHPEWLELNRHVEQKAVL